MGSSDGKYSGGGGGGGFACGSSDCVGRGVALRLSAAPASLIFVFMASMSVKAQASGRSWKE